MLLPELIFILKLDVFYSYYICMPASVVVWGCWGFFGHAMLILKVTSSVFICQHLKREGNNIFLLACHAYTHIYHDDFPWILYHKIRTEKTNYLRWNGVATQIQSSHPSQALDWRWDSLNFYDGKTEKQNNVCRQNNVVSSCNKNHIKFSFHFLSIAHVAFIEKSFLLLVAYI